MFIKSDLCMIRNCKQNNGLFTCRIQNGLAYATYVDIIKVETACEKYENDEKGLKFE